MDDLVDFELSSSDCATLDAKTEVFISIMLVFTETIIGDGEDFDLKSIIIDLSSCSKKYNVIIGSV